MLTLLGQVVANVRQLEKVHIADDTVNIVDDIVRLPSLASEACNAIVDQKPRRTEVKGKEGEELDMCRGKLVSKQGAPTCT